MIRTVVLLSGGIDSAVLLHMLAVHDRQAIGFDYGQGHAVELDYAARIAADAGVPFSTVAIPHIGKVDDVVFAGRNAVLLSVAASIAAARGYQAVAIGCNYSDFERFPDCRPEFLKAMASALHYAYGVHLLSPLTAYTKAQVVQLAHTLGIKLKNTWSCYAPVAGKPCGACLACDVRARAGA